MVSISTGAFSLAKFTMASLPPTGRAVTAVEARVAQLRRATQPQIAVVPGVQTRSEVTNVESAAAATGGPQSLFVNLAGRLKESYGDYVRRADRTVDALKAVLAVVDEFKTLNTAAASPEASAAAKASAAARMAELAPRIESFIRAAGSDGINWLETSGPQTLVVPVDGRGSTPLTFDTRRLNDAAPGSRTALNALLTTRFDAGNAGSGAVADAIAAAADQVASALVTMTGLANALASTRMRGSAQAADLGRLVSYDLDAQGAGLKAKETKQQLAALSLNTSVSRVNILAAVR